MVVRPHEKAGIYRVEIVSEKAAWGLGTTKVELIVDEPTLRMFRNEIEKVVGPKSKFDLFGEKE